MREGIETLLKHSCLGYNYREIVIHYDLACFRMKTARLLSTQSLERVPLNNTVFAKYVVRARMYLCI